jgi:hypothetical protein
MSAGYVVTKTDSDNMIGAITRDVNSVFTHITQYAAWLDATGHDDLVAMGYSENDIANLRTAIGDLKELADVYTGASVPAQAKDFRIFISRLWGLGW